MAKLLVVFLLLSLLSACGTSSTLEGDWLFTEPNGDVTPVSIQDFGDNNYYLYGNDFLFSGKYFYKNSELTLKKANDPRLIPVVMKKKAKFKFVVTQEPVVRLTGKRILGSSFVKK